MRIHFLLTALATLVASSTYAGGDSPAQIVAKLYAAHQRSSQDGVPDAKLRAKYEPYISPELTKLLADAERAEARYAKANPDSPPMVEGDLFSSNFEGITSFHVKECMTTRTMTQCAVQLHYATKDPRPQDKPVDWTDTVTLVETPAGWRVDDIAFGGNWAFGNHGALKSVLKNVIADAEK